MSSFDLVTLLLLLASVLGCINQLWFHLPRTIGLMAGALAVSAIVVVVDRLTPTVDLRGWWATLVEENDLPHVFLDGVLAFMLFAGSLHVNMAALRDNKWTVLVLATVGTLLATSLFGVGIWFALGQRVPLPWCFVLGAILAPPIRSRWQACYAASACPQDCRRSSPVKACSTMALRSLSSPWRSPGRKEMRARAAALSRCNS